MSEKPPCSSLSYNSLTEVAEKAAEKAAAESPCPKTINSDEKVFTSALLIPMYLTAAYLYFLKLMADSLAKEADSDPNTNTFNRVWISGPITFSCLYLLMIYFGKKWMSGREEYQIKPYIFTYNLYQCVLNLWCVIAMAYEVYSNPWFTSVWGNTPQRGSNGFKISFLVWVHYNNKYVELLDTVWMVLRKKNNQVSFLHCYHHILLIWAWYCVCKIETGGDSYFGAAVNSFIHVIMYGYYTLALLGIDCPWKKWITNCQMLQFCVCLAHSCYVYLKGNLPKELPLLQAFVMLNMLVLFGNFYVKTYSKKNAEKGAIKKSIKTK